MSFKQKFAMQMEQRLILKIMKPTDIDAIDANNLKETRTLKTIRIDVNLRPRTR